MSALKLYFVIMGAILGCLLMYAIANRPEMNSLRASVESEVADYRRTHPHAPRPETRADDWLIAAAYTARLEGAGEFRCIGAAHVSVCTSPGKNK